MNIPDGEGLYLIINRVVERPCPTCYAGLGEDIICDICNRTGLYKVRVRGWVECSLHEEFVYVGNISEWECETKLIEKVVAAYLAGTLPKGVAHIKEVVV